MLGAADRLLAHPALKLDCGLPDRRIDIDDDVAEVQDASSSVGQLAEKTHPIGFRRLRDDSCRKCEVVFVR